MVCIAIKHVTYITGVLHRVIMYATWLLEHTQFLKIIRISANEIKRKLVLSLRERGIRKRFFAIICLLNNALKTVSFNPLF